ncbi:Uncharacterized protein YutD [Granulicatella balaenopterae]|uniref:Uncharacterized protein YutD n=1 Tax=Granulicatella balaenopterae TaxID=137733 RepID=A0A1H9NSI3_9LACT|nr:YutD family protein [Granulicatella balaenopterae]SER38293.1 Uncharacterized protein YutD [Granulicatella balaenopterae]
MKEDKQKKVTITEKDIKEALNEITVDGESLVADSSVEPVPQYVEMIDKEHLTIQGVAYTLIENYRDGFNAEALNGRYHDVLDKYDYIVGDWGFEQLRLKGFFRDDAKQVTYEKKIQYLQDYLYEFCNFGCSYFVIKRDVPVPIEERTVKNFEKRQHKKRSNNSNNKNKKAYQNDKKTKKRSEQFAPTNKKKKDTSPRNPKNKKTARNFQIKERDQAQMPKNHKTPVKVPAKGPTNKNRKKQFKIRETK